MELWNDGVMEYWSSRFWSYGIDVLKKNPEAILGPLRDLYVKKIILSYFAGTGCLIFSHASLKSIGLKVGLSSLWHLTQRSSLLS